MTPEPTVTPEPTSTPVPTVTPVPTPTPEASDGEIIINDNRNFDTLIAGRGKLQCAIYSKEQFKLDVKRTDFYPWQAESKWYLKNNDDSVSISDTDNAHNAWIIIGADSKHGFTLCIDYTQYTNWDKKNIDFKIHAERTFNVVTGLTIHMTDNKGNIISDGDKIYMGEKYFIKLTLDEYDINGNYIPVYVTSENGNFYNDYGDGIYENKKDPIEVSADKQYWIYAPTSTGEKTIDVMQLGGMEDGRIFNGYNYEFSASMKVNVIK